MVDLESNGDNHNDESQLTEWAKNLGFPDLKISYGASDGSKEGNIAWARKEDIEKGVITGGNSGMLPSELRRIFGYSEDQMKVIIFLRKVEETTRHKVEPIPGLERKLLLAEGVME